MTMSLAYSGGARKFVLLVCQQCAGGGGGGGGSVNANLWLSLLCTFCAVHTDQASCHCLVAWVRAVRVKGETLLAVQNIPPLGALPNFQPPFTTGAASDDALVSYPAAREPVLDLGLGQADAPALTPCSCEGCIMGSVSSFLGCQGLTQFCAELLPDKHSPAKLHDCSAHSALCCSGPARLRLPCASMSWQPCCVGLLLGRGGGGGGGLCCGQCCQAEGVRMQSLADSFPSAHPGATVLTFDTFSFFMNATQNAASLGFTDTTNPCIMGGPGCMPRRGGGRGGACSDCTLTLLCPTALTVSVTLSLSWLWRAWQTG